MPNTKIVATLGPATSSEAVIQPLLPVGGDAIGFNALHGAGAERAGELPPYAVRARISSGGRHCARPARPPKSGRAIFSRRLCLHNGCFVTLDHLITAVEDQFKNRLRANETSRKSCAIL